MTLATLMTAKHSPAVYCSAPPTSRRRRNTTSTTTRPRSAQHKPSPPPAAKARRPHSARRRVGGVGEYPGTRPSGFAPAPGNGDSSSSAATAASRRSERWAAQMLQMPGLSDEMRAVLRDTCAHPADSPTQKRICGCADTWLRTVPACSTSSAGGDVPGPSAGHPRPSSPAGANASPSGGARHRNSSRTEAGVSLRGVTLAKKWLDHASAVAVGRRPPAVSSLRPATPLFFSGWLTHVPSVVLLAQLLKTSGKSTGLEDTGAGAGAGSPPSSPRTRRSKLQAAGGGHRGWGSLRTATRASVATMSIRALVGQVAGIDGGGDAVIVVGQPAGQSAAAAEQPVALQSAIGDRVALLRHQQGAAASRLDRSSVLKTWWADVQTQAAVSVGARRQEQSKMQREQQKLMESAERRVLLIEKAKRGAAGADRAATARKQRRFKGGGLREE
jgi:hypothetical protein